MGDSFNGTSGNGDSGDGSAPGSGSLGANTPEEGSAVAVSVRSASILGFFAFILATAQLSP
jgi:hypothetical protein